MPFGLQDAERIVRRLAPALHAHGEWIQGIHATLVCRSADECTVLCGNGHEATQLGRWFAEETSEFICRHPEYVSAMRYHREVFSLAQRLCKAVLDEQGIAPTEYAAFAEAINRLDRCLETLIKELWDLLRYTDPLTGIATRYAMMPRLREEHQRVGRTGLTSSVCMADLDRFKSINDSWGHHAGDVVLEAVSAYFVGNLRRYDQVCRYGGEEFVLMLPNTTPEQAVPIVDRLRRGLAALQIPIGDKALQVTASFGIAPLTADQPIAVSIERADKAMYQAKRAGRDRVEVWPADQDEEEIPETASGTPPQES